MVIFGKHNKEKNPIRDEPGLNTLKDYKIT